MSLLCSGCCLRRKKTTAGLHTAIVPPPTESDCNNTGPLTEFTLFPKLPAELRAFIWRRVPQPARVIGQVPCPTCLSHGEPYSRCLFNLGEWGEKAPMRRSCTLSRHPDWKLRYMVLPQHQAIFPPLHACRESRAVWLPRYFRPPRYLNLNEYDSAVPSAEQCRVRFDAPFISYETDIFTVFDAWSVTEVSAETFVRYHVLDPFLGLHRERIQHVGVCEIPGRFAEALIGLDLQRLPHLRRLSLLTILPDPHVTRYHTRLRLLKLPSEIQQHVNCELRDIPDHLMLLHPLFRQDRLFHELVEQDKHNYSTLLQAWLWHAKRLDTRDVITVRDAFLDFAYYVLGSADGCPLVRLKSCGRGGHWRSGHWGGEMLQWEPPFEIDCKMLYEETLAASLEDYYYYSNQVCGSSIK